MDFRWDQGFITDKADYLEKCLKLQQELEQLALVHEALDTAANLLEHFSEHEQWEACNDDMQLQHRPVKLIVERVCVKNEQVVALTLK